MISPQPTDWKWLLFSVDGRISRGQLWHAALIYLVIVVVLLLLLPPLAIMPIVMITLWCMVAVLAKRLHDRDRSGWWMFGFTLVQAVLDALSRRASASWSANFLDIVALAVTGWAFVEVFCLKGATAPNRYGPPPQQAQGLSAARRHRAAS